jgi:hypothetical protein
MPEFATPTNEPLIHHLSKQTQNGNAYRSIWICGPDESGSYSLMGSELLFPPGALPIGPLPFLVTESSQLLEDMHGGAADLLQQHSDMGWAILGPCRAMRVSQMSTSPSCEPVY